MHSLVKHLPQNPHFTSAIVVLVSADLVGLLFESHGSGSRSGRAGRPPTAPEREDTLGQLSSANSLQLYLQLQEILRGGNRCSCELRVLVNPAQAPKLSDTALKES